MADEVHDAQARVIHDTPGIILIAIKFEASDDKRLARNDKSIATAPPTIQLI